jgi:outer membrane autotransporter protein
MQPALYTSAAIIQQSNAVAVNNALNHRLQNILDDVYCLCPEEMQDTNNEVRYCRPDPEMFHVWANGLGDFMNQKNNFFSHSPQVGYKAKTAGAVGGIDFNFAKSGIDFNFAKYLYAGLLGAYTHSNINWNHQGKGKINSSYAGVYLSAIGRIFYGNASIMGGWSHYHEHRNIAFTGTYETARNSHRGAQVLSHLDTGLNFGIKGFTVRPFDAFDYITQTEHKYNESGAGAFDLAVLEKKFNMYRNELGLSFARCFNLDPDNKITVDAKLSWVYEKRIKGKATTASFLGTTLAKSPKFTVHGYYTNRSFISPGLTISYDNDLVDLSAYYDGQFGTKYRNQNVGLEAGFSF